MISLANCRFCVFDEADRLFEMGFALQLQQLLTKMSPERQTLLFSATMPRELAAFARAGLRDDVALVRLEQEATLSDTLRIAFFTTRSRDKPAAFCAALRRAAPDPAALTIVFVATRHHCELLLAYAKAVFPERRAVRASARIPPDRGRADNFSGEIAATRPRRVRGDESRRTPAARDDAEMVRGNPATRRLATRRVRGNPATPRLATRR